MARMIESWTPAAFNCLRKSGAVSKFPGERSGGPLPVPLIDGARPLTTCRPPRNDRPAPLPAAKADSSHLAYPIGNSLLHEWPIVLARATTSVPMKTYAHHYYRFSGFRNMERETVCFSGIPPARTIARDRRRTGTRPYRIIVRNLGMIAG